MAENPKAKKALLWRKVTIAARDYGRTFEEYVENDEADPTALALTERALEQAARAWADAGEGPCRGKFMDGGPCTLRDRHDGDCLPVKKEKPACICDLRDRQWDPNTGKCHECGLIFKK